MTAAAGQAQAEASSSSSSSSSSSLSLCCRRGGHCPVLTACAPPFSRPVSPSMASTSSSSDPNLSILILAILGILATAFVLLTYYVIVAKCCTRLDSALRRSSRPAMDVNMNWHVLEDGLEESLIRAIPIIKLKDAVHLHEQNSDCSVCLTEFCEHDLLRMLPKCSHVFHVECIDSWLRSHCSCPLCRAVIVPGSQTCLSTTTGSDDLAAATLDASSSDDPRPRRNDTISDPDLSFLGSISSTRSGAGLCRNQARAVSDLVDRFRHSSRKIHNNSNKDSTCLGLGSSCPEQQEQEGSSSFQAGVRRSFSMDSAAFKHYHGHSFAGDVIGSENLIGGSACHFDFGTSSTPSRKHGFLFFGSRGAGPPRNAILPV